jgi:hypothetical protein
LITPEHDYFHSVVFWVAEVNGKRKEFTRKEDAEKWEQNMEQQSTMKGKLANMLKTCCRS